MRDEEKCGTRRSGFPPTLTGPAPGTAPMRIVDLKKKRDWNWNWKRNPHPFQRTSKWAQNQRWKKCGKKRGVSPLTPEAAPMRILWGMGELWVQLVGLPCGGLGLHSGVHGAWRPPLKALQSEITEMPDTQDNPLPKMHLLLYRLKIETIEGGGSNFVKKTSSFFS